ncbi:MAG: hypothetical protein QOG54_899 [Actinomycetota bacterium]|jgi:hypothetical protein|nr:hypothetical protein [Actinomycetota bacterium]
MEGLGPRRRTPFAVVAAIAAIICVAIIRLPDAFVIQMERNGPFSSSQAGWAYRLLAFAAVGQALYGGFVILRVDRVRRARLEDPKVAALLREDLISTVARTAAAQVFFTVIYGVAAFIVTGQRGGFWLFPLIAVAQAAWYYRQVGVIGHWLGFQPATMESQTPRSAWEREPPDYCPPIARGLKPPAEKTA